MKILTLLLVAMAESWWSLTPHAVREQINQRIMSIEAPIAEVGSVQDELLQCGERVTPIRIYTPKENRDFPVILLIHGGAFVAGVLIPMII
jgi:acetyl esterase